MSYARRALVASPTAPAQAAARELADAWDWCDPADADVVIALGGDGFLLQTLHTMLERRGPAPPVFGMNLGTVGFLMNEWRHHGLDDRLEHARAFKVLPLKMTATGMDGRVHTHNAINEVSLLRETRQAAKLRILVDGKERLPELSCDGILLATPAGSTAYNLSAHGPIVPLDANLLALTPISAFRPRRWRGALLPSSARVMLEVLEAEKRPVSATADQTEVRDVRRVEIREDRTISMTMLFDPDRSLGERIIAEQFTV